MVATQTCKSWWDEVAGVNWWCVIVTQRSLGPEAVLFWYPIYCLYTVFVSREVFVIIQYIMKWLSLLWRRTVYSLYIYICTSQIVKLEKPGSSWSCPIRAREAPYESHRGLPSLEYRSLIFLVSHAKIILRLAKSHYIIESVRIAPTLIMAVWIISNNFLIFIFFSPLQSKWAPSPLYLKLHSSLKLFHSDFGL